MNRFPWFIIFLVISGCVKFTINEQDYLKESVLRYTYKGAIGDIGTGTGQYLNPADIDVDVRGKIFILDGETNRILVFTDTLFSHQFGGFGSKTSRLTDPTSFAVSPNYIHVFDNGTKKIVRFNHEGDFMTSFVVDENIGECTIALDDFGDIYLCAHQDNRILKVSPTGEEITAFGSFGWGEGFLNNPQRVVIAQNGDIYVSDTGNSRIQVFNSLGQFRKEIGSGILRHPTDLELDAWNNLYVCDTGLKKLLIFDAHGKQRNEIQEMIYDPSSIALSNNGKLYIIDKTERKIFLYSMTPEEDRDQ